MKLFSLALCLLISSSVFGRTTPSDVLKGAKVHFESNVTVGAGDIFAVLTGERGSVRSCWFKLPQPRAQVTNVKGQWSAVKNVAETVETALIDLGVDADYIQTSLFLENGNEIECNGKYNSYDSLNLEDVVLSLENRGIILE